MFRIGDTIGIYPHSDLNDVPVGQGVLAAPSPKYEAQDLRWRTPGMTRSRLWFDPVSRVEVFEGAYMLRPEWQARDANLLAKLFPPAQQG